MVKNPPANTGDTEDTGSIPGSERSSGGGNGDLLQILDWRNLILMYLDIPKKAMAPHSSTLAWKIPWTEEPGRLQSMGSLGVRRD